jgi:hypothetical protein
VVRGPAALLAVVGAALAYVLVAPELPQLHPPELSALVASAIGLTLVVAVVAGMAAMADSPFTLFPAVLGSGLLVAALDANGVAGAATPFEVVLLCCLGIAFAVVFDVPALAVALPLFLGAIDVVQALGGGSAGLFTLSTSKPGDVLTLDLPAWGTGLAAARLSATDVVFLGAFAAYARRLGLRERAAIWPPMSTGSRHCSRVAQTSNVRPMDLEEKTLEQVGDRCEECGAKLTERELELVLESGGPALCTVHAQEEVPVSDEDALEEEV